MSTINCKKSDKHTNLKYLPQWPPVSIEFQDLSYYVPDPSGKKYILNGISGQFQSSQITAILGASGAGKSTLLNILAGFKTSTTSANVLINGKARCIKTFSKMSRYIMQKDLHHHHLTVHEAMMVSADLKLGNHLTKLQKKEVIEQILDLLGLTNTSQTMCEVLSGGEMKRLSIALELVDNPPVIFLDEPTTGLDDLSSSQCISLLRRIALGGRTIVCSIHTPSAKIFEMFDLVYAMAGGQCVYQGSPSQIIPYLQTTGLTCPVTYNPADFIVEVSCGDYGIDCIDRMVTAAGNGRCNSWSLHLANQNVLDEQFPEDIDPRQLKCRSTSWEQFKVLHNRRWTQMWRDSKHIKLQISVTLCVALLVGCLFKGCGNDATKAIFNIRFHFTTLMFCTFTPIMPVLLRFPGEIDLLKREHFNRWFKLAPYYWSLLLGTAPIQLVLPLTYVAVTYLMSDQPMECIRMCRFFSVTTMLAFISESMGLLIASRFRLVIGILVGPLAIIPFMILAVSGIGYGKDAELPLHLMMLRNFSYIRFGWEGMFEALYGYDRADSVCPNSEIFCWLANADRLKSVLGMHDANYLVSMVVLWSYYLGFVMTAYFMIKMRLKFSAAA
ncbi:ATP-binding cassette sub-family G member 1-like isoform X3 [Bradysia coprophila]|uniref:ATP-binding cassette sub-family G member 1-like isoform X3 n=1 Tax=Bradysia coprophila TaxID=38358 RepID=UPI00187DCE95|nr:ATP-binding cassette sub-family G member 1-like isoform X3 [Bradysia coprophila]